MVEQNREVQKPEGDNATARLDFRSNYLNNKEFVLPVIEELLKRKPKPTKVIIDLRVFSKTLDRTQINTLVDLLSHLKAQNVDCDLIYDKNLETDVQIAKKHSNPERIAEKEETQASKKDTKKLERVTLLMLTSYMGDARIFESVLNELLAKHNDHKKIKLGLDMQFFFSLNDREVETLRAILSTLKEKGVEYEFENVNSRIRDMIDFLSEQHT